MTTPQDEFERVFFGIHYREFVETDFGEVPEREIDEVTLDRRHGGSESFQRSKRHSSGCHHIAPAIDICVCGKTTCKECRCTACGRGTCRSCSVRFGGKLLCRLCAKLAQDEKQQAQVQTVFLGLLQGLGLVE